MNLIVSSLAGSRVSLPFSKGIAFKRFGGCLLAVATLLMSGWVTVAQAGIDLTPQQQQWIAHQGQKTLQVSFDPYSGMDSFVLQGKRQGFVHSLLADIHKQTGLKLVAVQSSGWDDAYTRFVEGKTDILYGANVTPEREKIMRFTAPAQRHPYVVLARKDGTVKSLGDINSKTVGFIANDFVLDAFPQVYPQIRFKPAPMRNQEVTLSALLMGTVDAFVTSGGGVETEYLVAHPELSVIAELRTITSDMTLAVARNQLELGGILDSYLAQRVSHIEVMAREARIHYRRKALQLTDAELTWLEKQGTAVVGVAEDYLPFDYQHNGQYKGIAGEVLQEIALAVGMKLKVVSGPFAKVMEEARAGRVHVVNMAKTDERLRDFVFPTPFSPERDIVIGHRNSQPLPDIYALENARIAVIDGFWHEEYLRRNLRQPRIIPTKDILESLRKVRSGEADYLIENPTVADYYINGLGYQNLIKRGDTSGDSSLYFGVSRTQPELAGIMDKVIPLLPYEAIKYRALQSVPEVENESNQRLKWLSALLAVALVGIVLLTAVIARRLTRERLRNQFLNEREKLLYTDALTGFFNRNHYNDHVQTLEQNMVLPAAIVVADLNHLKRTNDTYGHASGDQLLQCMAEVLRAHWPEAHGYRMGGDEYLMVLEAVDPAKVALQIESLYQRCTATQAILPDGSTMAPSAAVGYFIREQRDVTLDMCLAQADRAMYIAKTRQKRRSTDPRQ